MLRIQSLLHTCSEFHASKEEAEKGAESEDGVSPATSADTQPKGKDDKKPAPTATPTKPQDKGAESHEPGAIDEPGSHQAISVLGIALIAMGEEIGGEMALRSFSHLVRGGGGW